MKCQRSPVPAPVIEEEKGPEASHVQTVEMVNDEKGIGRKIAFMYLWSRNFEGKEIHHDPFLRFKRSSHNHDSFLTIISSFIFIIVFLFIFRKVRKVLNMIFTFVSVK